MLNKFDILQNGTAQVDRNFHDFSEFCLFFTFVKEWQFLQSSSEEYKFLCMFVILLDKNMQIFLQNGDAQSQKLLKFQIPTKLPF